MAQVKFYSVAADATKSDAAGIYFVNGGELYKGTSRFGANKVFTVANADALAAITGQIGGDIAVGFGAAKVWDAEFVNQDSSKGAWRDLGADNNALASLWQADISTWTAGLVAGGAGSYITGITQGEDGKVTATAAAFPELNLSANTESSTANGITVSVTTESGAVTGVQVAAADISATSVTAGSGTFTNLTVSDTASFNATTVSASNLTVGGSTIEQLADKQIAAIASHTETSTALGITVSVTTSAGSVSGVYVDATSFGNAMHFVGVKASTGEVAEPASGDIIVIGSTPATGFVAGQEYIYDGTAWELIGDQNTYALNAYAPGTETVTASTTTLPAATHAIASKVDEIAAALSDFTYSSVTGGSSSSTVNGVTVEVVNAATTAAPTVTLTGVGTAASVNFASTVTSDGTALPTQSAVATAIQDAALVWLDASGVAIA